jgi:hypothetical protein
MLLNLLETSGQILFASVQQHSHPVYKAQLQPARSSQRHRESLFCSVLFSEVLFWLVGLAAIDQVANAQAATNPQGIVASTPCTVALLAEAPNQSLNVYNQQHYASLRAPQPGYQGVVATQILQPSSLTSWHQPRPQRIPATPIFATTSTFPDSRELGISSNNRVTRAPNLNYSLTPPQSTSASSRIYHASSLPQELAFLPTPTFHLLPTSNFSSNYLNQVNKMSDHEASRLERSPNVLQTGDIPTDPALENPHHHQEHVHHQEHMPMHHMPQHQDMQPHPDHMHHHVHPDHHEEIGEEMSSPDHQEPFSPRRGYTHKRSEEPDRNAQGKMICKFQSTCAGLTFDRRCEWRLVIFVSMI